MAEVTVNTTNGSLHVHDGLTPGGSELATVAQIFGSARTFTNRTLMKAINTSQFKAYTLTENGRAGFFMFMLGDFTARIAADTQEGIYMKADDTAVNVGAIVRVFYGPWWAHWFGISPSSTAAANVTAMNALMTLAVLSDTEISFQKGVHQFNAKIAKSTAFNLIMQSGAIDACTLEWTNADGGIDLTFTDALQPPTVKGFNFTTTVAGGGTALKITAPNSASITEAGVLLEDIDCRGSDTAADYWTNCIHLVNCWEPRVIRPDLKGLNDALNPFDTVSGLHV